MFRTFQVCKQEKKKSQFKLLTSRWQHQLKLWVAGLKKRNYRNNRRKQKKLISQVLNTKENITVSAVEKKWPTVYHTKVFLTAVKINLSLPLSTSYWHRVMPRNNWLFFFLFCFLSNINKPQNVEMHNSDQKKNKKKTSHGGNVSNLFLRLAAGNMSSSSFQ